jgi:hypothetical protein
MARTSSPEQACAPPGRVRARIVTWPTLALVLALYLAVNFLVVFVLFPSGALRVLAGPTGGLVSSTLVANAVVMVSVLAVLRWK